MQRKSFLKWGVWGLLPALPAPAHTLTAVSDPTTPTGNEQPLVVPPSLKPGDLIGITSPAGYITLAELQPALERLAAWGFTAKIGNAIGKRDGNFGGTDEERAADFQNMLNDPSVKAIMCARGGYGLIRIIDRLDFSNMHRRPKWIIGFSDVTVLHAHLNRVIRVASIHSKMCNSFPDVWDKAEAMQQETILSIRDALVGRPMDFKLPPNTNNRLGWAFAELIGGNCKTLETLAGSVSDITTRNKILFLEDTGEYLYSIDRMFWNLKRSGKLEHLAGLIIGGFKIKPSEDPAEEFNRDLYQIVLEKISDCAFPVCFDFPVGHQRNNYALKCGVTVQLIVNDNGVKLIEPIN